MTDRAGTYTSCYSLGEELLCPCLSARTGRSWGWLGSPCPHIEMGPEAHVTCLGQRGQVAELEPKPSDMGFKDLSMTRQHSWKRPDRSGMWECMWWWLLLGHIGWPGVYFGRIALSPSDSGGQAHTLPAGRGPGHWVGAPGSIPASLIHSSSPGVLSHFFPEESCLLGKSLDPGERNGNSSSGLVMCIGEAGSHPHLPQILALA